MGSHSRRIAAVGALWLLMLLLLPPSALRKSIAPGELPPLLDTLAIASQKTDWAYSHAVLRLHYDNSKKTKAAPQLVSEALRSNPSWISW